MGSGAVLSKKFQCKLQMFDSGSGLYCAFVWTETWLGSCNIGTTLRRLRAWAALVVCVHGGLLGSSMKWSQDLASPLAAMHLVVVWASEECPTWPATNCSKPHQQLQSVGGSQSLRASQEENTECTSKNGNGAAGTHEKGKPAIGPRSATVPSKCTPDWAVPRCHPCFSAPVSASSSSFHLGRPSLQVCPGRSFEADIQEAFPARHNCLQMMAMDLICQRCCDLPDKGVL